MSYPKKIRGFAKKKYLIQSESKILSTELPGLLREAGLEVSQPKTSDENDRTMRLSLTYRGLFFTTRKPLTCVSYGIVFFGSMEKARKTRTAVTVYLNFFKIKLFTAFLFIFLCLIIPITISWFLKQRIDIPPFSFLGLPLGIVVYFHVRNRTFRAFGKLIRLLESKKNVSQKNIS